MQYLLGLGGGGLFGSAPIGNRDVECAGGIGGVGGLDELAV